MYFDSSLIDAAIQPENESYAKSILTELRQCTEEGKDMKPWESLFAAVAALPDGKEKLELSDILYKIASSAPMRPDYSYDEPDEIDRIRALAPNWSKKKHPLKQSAALESKVRGAWLGRVAGCLLGKPVEGYGSAIIEHLARGCGNDPILRYFKKSDALSLSEVERLRIDHPWTAWEDSFEQAPASDDDINYPVMNALYVVDRQGRAFTSNDVAEAWMAAQPKVAYFTAERRALRNFIIGIRPPLSATYKNPDRELIGAQIRADYYAWINPGDPAAAAEMAWRDARISHVKNGIYGAMWMAGMIAWAAVCDDIDEIIAAGLEQIPKNCRLAEKIHQVIAWHKDGVPYEAVCQSIREEYEEALAFCWVHTLSNAMIVAAALLYGGGDFSASIGLAVRGGYDTDCNGASVGSVLGFRGGDACIDACWTRPLKGRLATQIIGHELVTFDELTALTLRHIALKE